MFSRRHWIERYRRLKKLGEGTYGVVYKAEHTSTKQVVAIKQIFMEESDEGIPSTTIREIALLKALNHRNVVRLNESIYHHENLYLVFDFFDHDLKQYMARNKYSITVSEIKHLLHQIVSGLDYCHSQRVYHRDLKPQNILIDRGSKHIKLADFGLSRSVSLPNKTWTHEVITLWYRPPEILLGAKHYSHTADVWSVGCIFGELCNLSQPLFRGDSEICQLMFIFKNLGTPSLQCGLSNLPHFKPNARLFPKWKAKPIKLMIPILDRDYLGLDLLARLLELEPQRRISAKQALKHPYFHSRDF